ncbi:MAG: hypothetical protein KJ906_01560 [Nanoarchaeota archaeon]|nr:hypothetical protein [Nanoarchaeota archaeon]
MILIPEWFFGPHSFVYIICAMIGFLVSFYSYRSYQLAKGKDHLYLYLGFASLSMAFLILGITELYSYLSISSGVTNMFEAYSSFRDFGIWIYYAGSVIAYALFALVYLPKEYRILPLFLPMWWKGFPYFHSIALLLLSFTIFRSTGNWFIKRTKNSMLVFISFLLIGFYHLLLYFAAFSELLFVLAHVSLILGFLSFFYMIFRVSRNKGRRK